MIREESFTIGRVQAGRRRQLVQIPVIANLHKYLNIFEYIKIKSHTQLQRPPLINKEQGKYWLFHIVTINRALDHWPNKPCTFEGALVPLWLNNPRISENPYKLVLQSRYYVVSLLLHRQRWWTFIRTVQLVFTTICNDPTIDNEMSWCSPSCEGL